MGEGGGGGTYTPLLLGFNIVSFKKDIILPSLSAPFVGSFLTYGSIPWY